MKKFRRKRFFIAFFILMAIQFLVGLANISFYQSNHEWFAISNYMMSVFSLPISLIHKELPFYINEVLSIKMVFLMINLMIQTALILGGLSLLRRVKAQLKY